MLKIPYSKVYCDGNELEYITEVLKSGWLTTASRAMEFETKMAQFVGAKYACAVNSATSALHLALDALGLKEGDKVFVPDMTFTASAEVVRYLNADPVFLDVEYGTSLITPDILLKAIKDHPEVRHLVVVHYGGQAAQMTSSNGKGIVDICKAHNIKIVEDAAHAFPSLQNGRLVGALGDITCFSFYANKTITTGEGGMLTTDDAELYKRCKLMRLHGINRDVWDRFTSDKPSWEYDVVAPGFKYNMPDVNAAIGLAQLERAREFHQERVRVATFYLNRLKDLESIDMPVFSGTIGDHAWHIFQIVLNEKAAVSRNLFIEKMSEHGIGTSVHYKPLHRMTYYKERYNLKPEDYPVSEKIWQGNVSLPIYSFMTNEELEYVVDTVKNILS